MTRLRIRRSTLFLCAFFLLTLAAYLLARPDTAAQVGGSARTPAHSDTHPATRSAVPVPPTTHPPASPSGGHHTGTAAPRRTAAPTATPAPTATTSSPPAATPSPTVTPTGTPALP